VNASRASGNRIRLAPDAFSAIAERIQSAQDGISGEGTDAPASEHGFSVSESGISWFGFDFQFVRQKVGGDQADPPNGEGNRTENVCKYLTVWRKIEGLLAPALVTAR